jgi:RNA polymerase sigma factor (sigma-70 family)
VYKLENQELVPHLFKAEYSKMVAVLCNHFGFSRIEDAQDIVSETFLKAAEVWGLNQIPPNPTAWLYTVAQNRARDVFRKRKVFQDKVSPALQEQQEWAYEMDMSRENIRDSQLKMMFVLCQPTIGQEAQIGLALRILCGFGIEEIARAFLTNKETINKRLHRARKKLQEKPPVFDLTTTEIEAGLDAVLRTIYLLFNEGCYSTAPDQPIRKEMCREAIRLALLLTTSDLTNRTEVNALIALMCFHASRIPARMGEGGEIILFQDQDRSKWEPELIAQGNAYLNRAATGEALSAYHLEAAIAWWHTQADTPEKWAEILHLYNLLLQLAYSPIAALNRTYALARVKGPEVAIEAALKINLQDHHLYFALLAHLYAADDPQQSRDCLQKGLEIAPAERDRQFFQEAIANLPE